MLTDDAPLYVDKLAFAHAPVQVRHLLTQEIPIVLVYETNFHRFSAAGFHLKSLPCQIAPHVFLSHRAQWENTARQHVLPQPPKEIGLVFFPVHAAI